ncbi:putative NADH:ubiquinone oxidoreductase, membrane subunit H [Candidatus Zinderia insecticola CARI]|uniref:NADH-quinone oxidoreductase subunit H n=1 Tax=Zinderia insecticola (strain CARI) TaxID=871271 RepID=E0TIU2_ZINIC|nr:putative NADH:ubiquinone oxidoreductase, membrane subunit H [Candidatus Zinderia insecticola CARI]
MLNKLIFYNIFKMILFLLFILFIVSYLIYWERKLIAWFHLRYGPNRTGIFGLLQPIADTLKLIFKEIIIPKKSNKYLFIISPILMLFPSFLLWSIIPFNNKIYISNIYNSLLFIISISSIEIYGIIIGGLSSNSKYAFLGILRAISQMISYEIPIAFCYSIIVFITKTSNIIKIVNKQSLNIFYWNFFILFPIFVIYTISSIIEINRHPFDVIEGESEIVAGYMIEYSGISFSLFFLSEYMNLIFVSLLNSLIFLGGWYSPFKILNFIPNIFWLIIKVLFLISFFIWIRATLPRFKYNKIIKLCWNFFLPYIVIYYIFLIILIKI